MKLKLLLLVCVCFLLQSWHTSPAEQMPFMGKQWQTAIKESKRSKKPIFIYFAAERCGACRKMEKTTMQNSEVSAFYHQNFISIRINVDEIAGYMRSGKWNIQAVPSVVFLDHKRKFVEKQEGFQSPQQFITKGEAIIQKLQETY